MRAFAFLETCFLLNHVQIDQIGAVESVKAASDIVSPLAYLMHNFSSYLPVQVRTHLWDSGRDKRNLGLRARAAQQVRRRQR